MAHNGSTSCKEKEHFLTCEIDYLFIKKVCVARILFMERHAAVGIFKMSFFKAVSTDTFAFIY